MGELLEYIEKNLLTKQEKFCSIPEAEVSITWPPDTPKPFIRQYRIPQKWHDYVTTTVQSWFNEGIIESADFGCQVNNPLLTAPKKETDGSVSTSRCRVCIDIRAVNKKLLENDRFPLPIIEEIFELLSGSTVFSIIDLDAAYNRFPIRKEDRHLTAFTWNHTQYQFAGSPFGLRHLPGHFQRVMSSILGEFSQFYIDDIIIFSRSIEEHIRHVLTILNVLTKFSLPISSQKS